jgi:hypothetical protein
MKILTRQQFLKTPVGTVFHYYKPCVFDGLYIKTSGSDDTTDFCMQELIGALMSESSEQFNDACDRMEIGESAPCCFDFSGREGLFDDEQLFAVLEDSDVEALIQRLIKRKEA